MYIHKDKSNLCINFVLFYDIWSSHGSEDDDAVLLGCDIV